jgi:WD40 repeat protein
VRVSNSELLCATYDPIKYLYIVGGSNGSVTMWSVDELKPVRALKRSASLGVTLPAHAEGVTSIVLDGNMAFTGGEDRKLFVWNTMTGERSKELTADGVVELQEVQQILVLPESGDVLVCTRSGQLLIFSQETGRPTASFDTVKEISSICWARHRQEIVAGLDDGTVVQIHVSMMRRLAVSAAAADDAAAFEGTSPSSIDTPRPSF